MRRGPWIRTLAPALGMLILAGCATPAPEPDPDAPPQDESATNETGRGTADDLDEPANETPPGAAPSAAGNEAMEDPPEAAPDDRLDCATTPLERRFDDEPFYTGPLFDDHFHMPQFFRVPDHPEAPIFDEEIQRRDVICLFGPDRIRGPFAFYGIPMHLQDEALEIIRDIDAKDPGNIVHFLELVVFPGHPVDPPRIERVLEDNPGLFGGYGEVSLYLRHYESVGPDDARMRALYGISERNRLVVMMHPIEGSGAPLERAMADFPNVIFLFHGAEGVSWASELYDRILRDYPNAYYSVDTTLFGQGPYGRPLLDSASSAEDFAARLGQAWDATLEQNVAFWKPKIEAHPDRFLWGTDRGGAAWHYTPETAAILEEFARAFIGRLDPAVQARYAHENAEAMLT